MNNMQGGGIPLILVTALISVFVLGGTSYYVNRKPLPSTSLDASLPEFTIASINMGGRFKNVFEFYLDDKEWIHKHKIMLDAITAEQCPREFYTLLDQDNKSINLNNLTIYSLWMHLKDKKTKCHGELDIERPTPIRDTSYWWANENNGDTSNPPIFTFQAYMNVWLNKCKGLSIGDEIIGETPQDMNEKALVLLFYDYMCTFALLKAFDSHENYLEFCARFPHVQNDETKYRILLDALKDNTYICIQEAFTNPQQINTIKEILNEHTLLVKEDAEMVLAFKDNNPKVVMLDNNIYNHQSQHTETINSTYESTTVKKTIVLKVDDALSIVAIHAKEPRNIPEFVNYLKDLGNDMVIAGDTNLEGESNLQEFGDMIAEFNSNFDANKSTTRKMRTVFQCQPKKIDKLVTSFKDVIMCRGRTIKSSHQHPSLDGDSFLPSPQHPSDHAYVVAEISH